MTNDFDLSIREIDDLLQHLYLKLRGKKEGLSLAEPAAILLAQLKSENPAFFTPQLTRFTPIIMDTLISGAFISFGYEGLLSLNEVAGDIELASGDYIPTGVEEGLSQIRANIDSISAILEGDSPGPLPATDVDGKGETGAVGFFRECAWGTVGLPLVSVYNTGKTPFSTGRVVKARVEIRITGEWSIRRKHEPAVIFDHISAEPNSTFESQIRTAVKVAESYAAAAMGMKGIFRVPREYRISLPEIASFPASAIQRLSGGSAGLAVTALLISVFSRLDLYKQRISFDSSTCFTGKVDDGGKILTVEDSHIADKVRAVFFSRFSRLILPAGNLDTAEKERASLSRKYPARKLDLVPALDVAGIFLDSGVTEKSATPAGKPLLQRLFMWRKHLVGAGSLAALVLISLLLVLPYYKRDIAEITFDGNRILIINTFGRLITEHILDFPIPKGHNQKYKIYIEDFDGNGANEGLCILSDSRKYNPSSPYNRLHFIHFDNEGRFWSRYIFDDEKLLGEQMNQDGQGLPIDISKNSSVFTDELGNSRFLAILHHSSRRPASAVNLSLTDFSSDIFLHQGFLFQMAIKDIDNDKIEDIILSGYNNILRSSIVVVLDQRYMNGSSPEGANYDIDGFDDIAKYYLRLPDFHLYHPFLKEWQPMTTKIESSQKGLIVTVHNRGNDVSFFIGSHMKCDRAQVLASMGTKGIPSTPGSSTFDYPEKQSDEENLRNGIRYWDGEGWTAEPSINRSFLDHATRATGSKITTVDHVGTHLAMMNEKGYEIADYDVGFRTPKSKAYRQIYFGDYLPEEGEEILCILLNSYYFDETDLDFNKLFILIFDEKGQLLRRHEYDEKESIGTELERYASRTGLQMVAHSSPFDEEFGTGTLFIGTHHKTQPPATTIRFSLDDGSYQVFSHKGFFSRMTPRDLDGDGRKELLLAGYNITLDAPVIIVLDPDYIDGSSPAGACYNIRGRDSDIAKYYIRLPLFDGYEKSPSRFMPLRMHILDNSDVLRFMVKSKHESVIYTISDNLHFRDVEIVELVSSSSGKVDSIVTMTYPEKEDNARALLQGVRFWDGESWVARPAVNSSYLKHAREGG